MLQCREKMFFRGGGEADGGSRRKTTEPDRSEKMEKIGRIGKIGREE